MYLFCVLNFEKKSIKPENILTTVTCKNKEIDRTTGAQEKLKDVIYVTTENLRISLSNLWTNTVNEIQHLKQHSSQNFSCTKFSLLVQRLIKLSNTSHILSSYR